MHINSAGHDDLFGNVVRFIGGTAGRLVDDAAVADEDIPDRVATVGRIDHASAGKTGQHGWLSGSAAIILPRALATDTAVLGLPALTVVSVAVAARCSTALWSTPGRPTAIVTSARSVSGLAVIATSGGSRFHVGNRAP